MKKLIILIFSINLTYAEIGNYLLVGTTTQTFIDNKYVSFKDKNGYEYKIPRVILPKDKNSKVNQEQIVLFKEIAPELYSQYRKECNEYFKGKKMKPQRGTASDKVRMCL